MNLRSFRIGARLRLGFGGCMATLILLLAGSSLMNIKNRDNLIAGIGGANEKAILTTKMKGALLEGGIAIRNIGVQSDVSAMQKEEETVEVKHKEFVDARDKLMATGLSDAESKIVSDIADIDGQIAKPFKEAMAQALAFNSEGAAKIIAGQIDPLTLQELERMNNLIDEQQTVARLVQEDVVVATKRELVLFYLISAITLAIGILLTWRLTNSITAPLSEALRIAQTVASGDLSSHIEVMSKDETGQLLQALKDMNSNLIKMTEEALRNSEQRFSAVFQHSPVAIFITRLGGDYAVVDINNAFEQLFLRTRDSVIGKTAADVGMYADNAERNAIIEDLNDENSPHQHEVWMLRGDGRKVLVHISSHTFTFKGQEFAIFSCEDVTDKRRIEQEIFELNASLEQRVLERTAQLEAANEELETFCYSVSHDLRTPLRAIEGFSHILRDDYADKLDDEGKRLFNVVRDNTSRMAQLIDDILKFSRTGRMDLVFCEIDMEKLAHEIYEELLPPVADCKLQVKIASLPPAKGDRAMMRQVFINLLANAIKFSRNRETPMIEVGGSIEGGEAVYFVRDNGAGFNMQYVGKLFGVFHRLHGMNEFEGTGIGLAIVKRIVTRHGGRVWAEGKVDEGATIYFALPIKDS